VFGITENIFPSGAEKLFKRRITAILYNRIYPLDAGDNSVSLQSSSEKPEFYCAVVTQIHGLISVGRSFL
jgi:hypothetical protein